MATEIQCGYMSENNYTLHPGGGSVFEFSGGTICGKVEAKGSEEQVTLVIDKATSVKFALVLNSTTGAVIQRTVAEVKTTATIKQTVQFTMPADADVEYFVVYEL